MCFILFHLFINDYRLSHVSTPGVCCGTLIVSKSFIPGTLAGGARCSGEGQVVNPAF